MTNGRVSKPSAKKNPAAKTELEQVGAEGEDDVFGDIDFGAGLEDVEMDGSEDYFK